MVPAMRTIQLTTLAGMLIVAGIFTASADSDLSKYANKYPSERVGGRSFLNAIEKRFVSILGTEKWKRFASYSTEAPIRIENNELFGPLLLSHRCMPHNCYSEYAFIVAEAKTGRVVVGCFNRATEKKGKEIRDVEWAGELGERWSLHVRGPGLVEGQLARGAKRYLVRCEEEDWGSVLDDIFGAE